MARKLKKIIVPDSQGNPVEYDVGGVDADTASAGQVLTADGNGGTIWGDVDTSGGSAPTPVSHASDMTDTSKVYLYTGSESGYNAGHWYYYNGSAWIDGGEYGSGGSVTVDSALSGTSTNPVQNKVIKSALDEKLNSSDVLGQITVGSDMPIKSVAVTDYFASYAAVMFSLIRSGNLVSINQSFFTIYTTFTEGAGKVYFVMPNSQTDVVVLTVDEIDASQGKIYLSSVVESTLYEVVLTRSSNNSMTGTVNTTSLSVATTLSSGLMSATDKANLDTLMSDYQSASTALG